MTMRKKVTRTELVVRCSRRAASGSNSSSSSSSKAGKLPVKGSAGTGAGPGTVSEAVDRTFGIGFVGPVTWT